MPAIRYDQRATRGPRHRARVVNHFVQRHRDCRVQSQDHLPKRVTHEQQVYTGSIENPGHGRVVSSQHDNPLAALLHQRKIGHANFLRCSVQWAVFNSCSTEWFGLKCGEIFDLRPNFFMTRRFSAFRRFAVSRKRIEAPINGDANLQRGCGCLFVICIQIGLDRSASC